MFSVKRWPHAITLALALLLPGGAFGAAPGGTVAIDDGDFDICVDKQAQSHLVIARPPGIEMQEYELLNSSTIRRASHAEDLVGITIDPGVPRRLYARDKDNLIHISDVDGTAVFDIIDALQELTDEPGGGLDINCGILYADVDTGNGRYVALIDPVQNSAVLERSLPVVAGEVIGALAYRHTDDVVLITVEVGAEVTVREVDVNGILLNEAPFPTGLQPTALVIEPASGELIGISDMGDHVGRNIDLETGLFAEIEIPTPHGEVRDLALTLFPDLDEDEPPPEDIIDVHLDPDVEPPPPPPSNPSDDSDVFIMVGPYIFLSNIIGLPISYPAPVEGAEVTHCLGETTESDLWIVLTNQQEEDFEVISDRYNSEYDWRYWNLDQVPGEDLNVLESLGVHFFPVTFKSDWRTLEGDYQATIKVILKVPAITLKYINHEDFPQLQNMEDRDLIGVAYGISHEVVLTGHVVDCPGADPEDGSESGSEEEPAGIIQGGDPEIIIDPPIDPLKDAEFSICPPGPPGTGPSFGDMESCLSNPEYTALLSQAFSNGLSSTADWNGYIGTLTAAQYERLLELCPFEMGAWVMPTDQSEVWLKPEGESAYGRFNCYLGHLERQRQKLEEEKARALARQARDAAEKAGHAGQDHDPCECWNLEVEVDFSDEADNQFITSHDPSAATVLSSDQVGFIRGKSLETNGLYKLPYASSGEDDSGVEYWPLYEEIIVNSSAPTPLKELARQHNLSCCWTSHGLNHDLYVQVINYPPMGEGMQPTVPSGQPFNSDPSDVYEALALWTSYSSTPSNYSFEIINGSSIQQGSLGWTGVDNSSNTVGFGGKRMEWVYDWFNFAPSNMMSNTGAYSTCDIIALGPFMWGYWALSKIGSGHGTKALKPGLGKVELVINGKTCEDKTLYYQTLATSVTITEYVPQPRELSDSIPDETFLEGKVESETSWEAKTETFEGAYLEPKAPIVEDQETKAPAEDSSTIKSDEFVKE